MSDQENSTQEVTAAEGMAAMMAAWNIQSPADAAETKDVEDK
ncbi:hypothetical protein [Nocardia crassostreae]|nr:hypothetical protein [Nocardia crassostreae]